MGDSVAASNQEIIMKVLIVFAALLLCCCLRESVAFEQCGKKGADSRIVNGLPAGHGEFPWQISLQFAPYAYFKRQHICGGTLIAPNYVLCAAHCFGSSKNPSKFRVRVGEWHMNNADGTETEHEVESIQINSQYNKPHQVQNDISLIKLKTPVDFKGAYAGPACLPKESDDYHGATGCWLSGWGLVKPPRDMPNTLQKLQGKIWTDADLKGKWGRMIQPGMIGFGTSTSSACMGDSGGPLVCPNKSGAFDIVGVVSWGTGTCSGMPGVFTEVSHFMPWIRAHME